MLPRWLKRSALGLSFVFGAVTWFVLTEIWIHAAKDGLIDKAISALYIPAYGTGRYIGTLVFPDYAVHGTTGWYLIPLFGLTGEFVLLTAIWYFCIRLNRVFQPLEPEPLPNDDDHGHRDSFDGAHEPEYAPKWSASSGFPSLDNLFSTIDYEKFKLRTWREFHEHTGSWPLLSIFFHYATLLGSVAGAIVFFWLKDKRQWGDGRSFAIGILLAVLDVIFIGVGNSVVRKFDWRLFGPADRTASEHR